MPTQDRPPQEADHIAFARGEPGKAEHAHDKCQNRALRLILNALGDPGVMLLLLFA
jgi:hypothetical protein